jgi:hypothetical protein
VRLSHAERLAWDTGIANELRIESAPDPLRSRDDFRLLMIDVVFPTDAFKK